jgi:hypothetical protein
MPDAEWAWLQHSNSQEAGWLILYDAASVNADVLRNYLTEEYSL